jgi:hypothetical protein
MTTLATDAIRDYENDGHNSFPMVAADIIYEGAAVGDNGSGIARPLVAGDPFRGFALRKVDNSAGAEGDKRVEVRHRGLVVLPITSLAITDVGKDVYASDDNAFTLTQSTNTRIGYVYRWVSTGVGVVAFEANRGTIAELTAITGGESPTEAEHNLALAAINALIRRLGG